MTNQELKEKIINEFYLHGRISGYYFGVKSKSKANPVKGYIQNCLYKTSLIKTDGVLDNDFISDIYQEAFLHLWNYPTDKFVEIYNASKIKGSKIIALLLHIIKMKCFSVDKRTYNPKHSLVSRLGFASVFNNTSYNIPAIEIFNEDEPELIIFDEDYISDFEMEYGFKPEELIGELSPEAQFVFYQLLGKQPTGAPNKERKEAKAKLAEEIRGIKDKLENRERISDDR